MTLVERSEAALGAVVSALPGGGESRPGQRAMATAVADAIDRSRHLVVQAGTGTGKSIAYLVPAILSGRRVVVATATRALQDQLAEKDLPQLAAPLAPWLGEPLRWTVLKGRGNYACRQRLAEIESSGTQLGLDGLTERASAAELARLRAWAATSATGDRAELDVEPSPAAWGALSVGRQECPGASRCPSGGSCFAEAARDRARDAHVVVVNQHLLAADLHLGGGVLPEYDLVIIDEVHQYEDIVAAASGLELTAGRLGALAHTVSAVLADSRDLLAGLEDAGARLASTMAPRRGARLSHPLDQELGDALNLTRDRLARVADALRGVPEAHGDDVATRKLRATQAVTALTQQIDRVLAPDDDDVTWIEGTASHPVLRVAPVEVAGVLAEALWPARTAVLTSATVPPNLTARLGLPDRDHVTLDVGSPFAYEDAALLYCAMHLPDPRAPASAQARHDELEALIAAAGGRTLALFTSWRAMHDAVEALRDRLPGPILVQGEQPKPALLARFAAEEASCLFATMSFWQGIDVPGSSLSLVTVDRLPFSRPDDPLVQARRERAGAKAFQTIDVPRAAMMLAQGAGRLIRGANDRGVVAVLDPRLATARSYRWDIVRALPPMRRTRDRAEVEAYLRSLHRDAGGGGPGEPRPQVTGVSDPSATS